MSEVKNTAWEGLKGKFEIVGVVPGIVVVNSKEYDLRTISADEAKHLLDVGCPFIKVVANQGSKGTA